MYEVRVRLTSGVTETEVVPADNELDAVLRAGVSLANKGKDGYEVLATRSEEDIDYG